MEEWVALPKCWLIFRGKNWVFFKKLGSYGAFRFLEIEIWNFATDGSIWNWKYDLRIDRSISKTLCFSRGIMEEICWFMDCRIQKQFFNYGLVDLECIFLAYGFDESRIHFNLDNFWTHSSKKILDHSIQNYVMESWFQKTKTIGKRLRDTSKPPPSETRLTVLVRWDEVTVHKESQITVGL